MREIKHLSVHQWLRSDIPDSQQPSSPIGFLFLKLLPPPCVSNSQGSMNLRQDLYVRPSGAPRRPPLELLFVELHEEAPVARSVSDLGATIRPWDGHGMYRDTTWRHRNFEGT